MGRGESYSGGGGESYSGGGRGKSYSGEGRGKSYSTRNGNKPLDYLYFMVRKKNRKKERKSGI